MKKIFIPIFLISLLLPLSVSAQTYYVDNNDLGCSDSNPGTESQPWCTIQKAANTMVAGDMLIVKAGTYDERVSEDTSGSEGNLITYQANPGDTVTVSDGFILSGNYIKIDGFEITCTNPGGDWGGCVQIPGDNCVVTNCIIEDGARVGIKTTPSSDNCNLTNNIVRRCLLNGMEIKGRNHLIENNEIDDIRDSVGGVTRDDANGFMFFGSGHVFRGNYIYGIVMANMVGFPHIDHFQTFHESSTSGNEAGHDVIIEKNHCHHYQSGHFTFMLEGTSSYPAHHITIRNNLFEVGWGVNCGASWYQNDIYIYHNTFIGDPSFTTNWPVAMDLSGVTNYDVRNNVFVDYRGDGFSRYISGGSGTVDYNIVWNSDGSTPSGNPSPQPNELWGVDPRFVNFVAGGGGNYSLQSDSPAIDNGITLSQVTDDYDGNPRPIDGDNNGSAEFDIGAYEYQEEANICNQADILCVDDTPGDYQEYSTIQACANVVQPGQTCLVFDGTYNERVMISTSGSEDSIITFNASGRVTTKGFVITGDYVTVNGFEVTDTPAHWADGYGFYVSGDYVTVNDNYVYYCTRGGIQFTSDSSNGKITNNRFYRNALVGIEVHGTNNLVENNEVWDTIQRHPKWPDQPGADADGIRFFGTGHTIRGNYIHDISYSDPLNVNPHIDCFQTWTGGSYSGGQNIIFEKNHCKILESQATNENAWGFMLEETRNLTIKNNIFQTFGGVNTGGGDCSDLTIVNNVFTSNLSFPTDRNPIGISLQNVPNAVVKNNILYDPPLHVYWITGTTTGHDIGYNLAYRSDGQPLPSSSYPNDLWEVDPRFVDPANDDFRLQSTSPAIDNGTTLLYVTEDYDGVSRPQGNGYDIGAYEYSGVPLPTCSDGTLYGQCSSNQPKYCDNGTLVDDCSTCDCPGGYDCQANGSCQLSGNVSTEPVAWYHFDEGSGTIVTDSSGNGNDGTINGGATYTTGKIGSYALQFDGISGYVDVGTTGFSASAGTVELWTNIDSFPSVDKLYIFSHYTPSPIANRIYVDLNPDNTWSTGMGDTYEVVRGSTLTADTTWYHLVITWDGTNARGYKNGGLDFGPASYSGLTTIESVAYFGSFNGVQEFFNGTIDEVRIYNRALTPEEISEHYNEGIGNYSAADLNEDGVVDIQDLAILTLHFGQPQSHQDWDETADVVTNNEIDIYDVVFVASRFT